MSMQRARGLEGVDEHAYAREDDNPHRTVWSRIGGGDVVRESARPSSRICIDGIDGNEQRYHKHDGM